MSFKLYFIFMLSIAISFKIPLVFSDTESILEEFDSPTSTILPQFECITHRGEAGECKEFNNCFPIFNNLLKPKDGLIIGRNNDSDSKITSNITEDEIPSTEKALREEILSIVSLSTDECSQTTGQRATDVNGSNPIICCAIQSNPQAANIDLSEKPFQDKTIDSNEPVVSQIPFPIKSLLSESCEKARISRYSRFQREQSLGNKTLKITGGRDAQPGQFPWMVAIFGKTGKLTCGASLITNDYILTAAHCLFTYTASDIPHLKVHLGDYNIKSLRDGPHETRKISKLIIHKGFNSKNYHNDIALMKLDKPVTFSDKIQPICLPISDLKANDIEGNTAIVTGWGRNRAYGSDSPVLRMVDIPVWKYSECQKVFNVFAPNRLTETNICAGDGKRNKDACIGDSGGPLVIQVKSNQIKNLNWTPHMTQIGIVSWGKGCGSFPGVYTSTASFLPWIEKNLRR